MTSLFRPQLALVVAILLATFEAFGYEAPLSDEAVREAYFLGERLDGTTARFLETYRRYFPIPKSGPHVYAVELFTPYAQAVEAASKHVTGDSAQQAKGDYRLRGDLVRVTVHIRYTRTYGPSRNWCDLQLKLRQRGKTFEARNVKYEGTSLRVGGGRGGSGSSPTGFIVWQEYETSSLASDETTVEIDTPDGQHVVASFDLSQLR